MTKQELILLIKECIQETQLKEGVALYFRSDNNGINKDDYENDINGTLQYWKDRDEIVVDFNFTKTRLEDLIVFDEKPVTIEKVDIPTGNRWSDAARRKQNTGDKIRINAFIPYTFRSKFDIDDNYGTSQTRISDVYAGHIKKIAGLKNYLRTAIKNLKSTDNIKLSSKNLEEIKEMVNKGLQRFNEYSKVKLSEFDVIIKVPSSAPLNDLIIDEIIKLSGGKPKIVTDLIFKKTLSDIRIDYKDWIKRSYDNPTRGWGGNEPRQRTAYERDLNKMYFLNFKGNLKLLNKDKEFQIKTVSPPEFRRYVKDFLKFNPNIDRNIYKSINGGKILIIDDTVGAKKTLGEAVNLLSTVKPSYIASFALLKDWQASKNE